MINADHAVSATFVTLGALEKNSNAIYVAWGNGAYELHTVFTQIGDLLSSMCKVALEKADCDFPGVFDYEVSEPIGEWLGDKLLDANWELDSEEIYKEAVRLVVQFFFKKGNPYQQGHLAGLIEASVPVKEIVW